MTNIIPKLWDLFLEKKKKTDEIIEKNINAIRNIIFSNQTAQLQFYTSTRDTDLILHMEILFRQHGYLTARILEFINEQELISISYDDFPDITHEMDEQLDNRSAFMEQLIGLLIWELRILYLIAQLKMKTLKVDFDQENKRITISPPTRSRDIKKSLTIKLSQEDHEWNAVFGAHNFPRRGITFNLGDSSGIGEVTEEEIKNKWELFKEVWIKRFRIPLNMNADDFFTVWECIKWLHIPIPFSENTVDTLVQQVGPGSEAIVKKMIQTYKIILPNLKDLKIVKSIEEIKKKFFHTLFNYGLGWKYTTDEGLSYFHISCQFTANDFIRSAFEAFFYEINDPGSFYEEEIKNRINLIKSGYVSIRQNRDFLVGYQPINQKNPVENVNQFNIQILERNHDITAPNASKHNISVDGEIDLIIYSNDNLFLLEAKSFFSKSLSSNIQYASDQCTKYREWIDTAEFNELIEKHKIQNLNKIFILILTNRQEERLYVKCNKSGYYFPIISFSLLPLLLMGFYTLDISKRKIVPSDLIEVLKEIVIEKFKDFEIIQENHEEFKKFRKIWRNFFYLILNSISLPANFDFSNLSSFPFDSRYTVIDYRIENSGNWELSEEIPIWEDNGFTFYLVTEIGNMKHSYVCKNCSSVWLYYFPESVDFTGSIYESLTKGICIKCGKEIVNQNSLKIREITNKTSLIMVFVKKQLWESKLQKNVSLKDRLKEIRKEIPF